MSLDLPIFEFHPGATPLLISVPHAGTAVPDHVAAGFSQTAHGLPDTDWLVDELYRFSLDRGVGIIRANYSRYVVDLNRPPDDSNLYGSRTTGLIPEIDFDENSIYEKAAAPDENERSERVNRFWQPYHYHLQGELNRLREVHGHAILLDAHSIAAEVPMLFSGSLPDFNLGSNDGNSAGRDLESRVYGCLENQRGYSAVRNGRFKGGYITRHYGSPANHIHALQLELSQATYLREGREPAVDPQKYKRLQPVLGRMVDSIIRWQPHA